MASQKGWFPFTADQTVNILSEFGPLVAMFVVNAIGGIEAGTWALIISTGLAIGVMHRVLGRLPMFPLIASTVTIVFGALTLYTHDPMWVQIKVTIFNVMFGAFSNTYLKKFFFNSKPSIKNAPNMTLKIVTLIWTHIGSCV